MDDDHADCDCDIKDCDTKTDPYLAAQFAAEDHIEALDIAVELSDAGFDVEWPDSLGPYCGCRTCLVREILHAARPFYVALAMAELDHRP